ncbi:MAG: hypothetical protein M3416_05430 [Acidobacteriota bacterium]|nr:hypothetical protein [Acidobacteriota bacterium]
MSVTFETLWGELVAQVPHLDQFASKKFVNRAREDIYRARDWSFLKARGVLVAPAAVATGAVSVTRGSDAFAFNGAAAAVLDVFGLSPAITDCQVKVSGGTPYQIASYNAGGAGTFDRPYQGETDSAAAYQVLRCYFRPPSSDFVRFLSVVNAEDEEPIQLGWTQEELDRHDPDRSDAGSSPQLLASYVADTGAGRNSGPMFELYPHPTSRVVLLCQYRKRGADFTSNSETLPDVISADLVLSRAKYRAYEWAEGAKGKFPSLKGTNWLALMAAAKADYKEDLKKCVRADRETHQDRFVTPQRGDLWRGAEWYQRHELPR